MTLKWIKATQVVTGDLIVKAIPAPDSLSLQFAEPWLVLKTRVYSAFDIHVAGVLSDGYHIDSFMGSEDELLVVRKKRAA